MAVRLGALRGRAGQRRRRAGKGSWAQLKMALLVKNRLYQNRWIEGMGQLCGEAAFWANSCLISSM